MATLGATPSTTTFPATAADVGAQPSDSDLTAIAALTTTAYGRSVLEAADAAALRALAGVVVGLPSVVQVKSAGTAAVSIVLNATPIVGHTLILVSNSTTGQITSVASTNTTWTQVATFTSAASSYYSIWIGVVGASPSATITFTKPGSFNSVSVMEIVDAVSTPAAAASTTAGVAGGGIFTLTGTGAGTLVVLYGSNDNTTLSTSLAASAPAFGAFGGTTPLLVAFGNGANILLSVSLTGNGAVMMVEVT